MSKVKILVVEDEIIIADNICDTLTDLGYETLEPAINFTEAVELIESESPDIAILDIQLSVQKTGIDLARKINEDYNFPFIFLTSNSDTVTLNEAKKVMPPAFLVKPFSNKEGEVNEANLIIKDAFFIKEKGLFIKINFQDILYLKAAHVYVEIMLKDKTVHVVRGSLNDIITRLNSKFIRVHRGYIINSYYLQQINHVYLKINEDNIPIGKTYREKLLKRINLA